MDNEIIYWLLKEKTDTEIAEILHYSLPTVKRKLKKLYKEYEVKGRVGLVREVVKEEIIKEVNR